MTATAPKQRVVVSDGRINPDVGRAVRLTNCIPAVFIGLATPMAVVLLVDPQVVARAVHVLPGLLVPVLFIIFAVFVYCVLVPGEVAAVSADPHERTLTVIEANLFSRRRTELSFRDIADVRMSDAYDHDGYATRRAEIVLRDGQNIPLPAWAGDAEAAALQRAVKGR